MFLSAHTAGDVNIDDPPEMGWYHVEEVFTFLTN